MKRFIFAALLLVFGVSANVATAGPHTSKVLYNRDPVRTTFVLPQVDGLNCYTADLHVHTMYSDGSITPDERVKEAWIDGLDIMAITDHLETRRRERDMLKFLKGYSPDKKGFEPINTRCSRGVPADERGIVSDLNYSVSAAQNAAKAYPELTIIKGTEISREPVHIGHYCALFTKDNNTIYSTDDAQTIRNARAQGAIITHNHPGWERTSTDYTEFEKKIYAEGLIDGIEVSNSRNFYPEIVRRAVEKKLYVVSATDCHATTASIFGHQDFYRDMTLIFAKDKSEKELRKALLSQKTLGYCGGYIIGEESLLEKFFKASVTATYSGKTKKGYHLVLTNNTSFAYVLNNNGTIIKLPAHSSVSATIASKKAVFTVENMYHVDEKHPTIELTINK
jgi:predicted metal-dependent phosphoesterase TrpH